MLAYFPRRPIDPILGVCTYSVTGTPFVLLYDFDDQELWMWLVIHGNADRSKVNLKSVVW